MKDIHVLVAEDEAQLNQMICDYLKSLDWQVSSVRNGQDAMELFFKAEPHILVLDIMMPGMDGLELTRRIRQKSDVPIIMLTARAEEGDKLLGLEIGADDYITKPFSLRELAARIRVILRRVQGRSTTHAMESISRGELFLDLQTRRLKKGSATLELTAAQFDMLQLMMASPGRVFKRLELLGAFQEDPWEGYERSVDVHIKNLRKIIEDDPSSPRYIETLWGVGYRFSEQES